MTKTEMPSQNRPRWFQLRFGWQVLFVALLGGYAIQLADRVPADSSKKVDFRAAELSAPLEPSDVEPSDVEPSDVEPSDVEPSDVEPGDELRVASFNIHSAVGKDGAANLNRIASQLQEFDLVALQEIRGGWFGQPDQAAQLGKLLSCGSVYLPTERQFAHDHFGQGVLSRIPLEHLQRIPLAGTRGKAFRSMLWSQFTWKKQTVNVLTVHIDSRDDRQHQLEVAFSLFEALSPPVLLMGDLNTSASDPNLKRLLARPDVRDLVADGISSERASGKQVTDRIDWILGRGFVATGGWYSEGDFSDHPLVGARIRLATEKQK